MTGPVKPLSRPYHAPQRAAAAARTREAIVTAAKDAFERLGWPGATMRGIADQAGVSVKTVEALYRTKAELLKHVVDYAIAGDLLPVPVQPRRVQGQWGHPPGPGCLNHRGHRPRTRSGADMPPSSMTTSTGTAPQTSTSSAAR